MAHDGETKGAVVTASQYAAFLGIDPSRVSVKDGRFIVELLSWPVTVRVQEMPSQDQDDGETP